MAVGGPWGPCGTSDGTKRSARPSPRRGAMVSRRNWREPTARSFPQHCSDPDLTGTQAPHMAVGGLRGPAARAAHNANIWALAIRPIPTTHNADEHWP